MKTTKNFQMVAKTMAELEDVLAEELIALGAQNVEPGNRMVSFTGDKALLYKANLHCRTALSILKPIHTFVANNADEVYEEIKKINWEDYLTLDNTFLIDSVVFSHIFRHSKFVSYRVKDGIADYFAEKYNKRPSVSVTNPDLVFNMHISHNKCTLSLDSSGDSLHKRGYRIGQTGAPLNEVLAAGMILKSGWRGESNFIDPMCGSGTLLIEAAMIALNIPPGIHKESFAFEKWPDFDSELFSDIYNDDSGEQTFNHKIIGTDISNKAIAIAERNIKNAGLGNVISLEVKPFQQYTEAPQSPGVLMTNPPYGERIRVSDIEALYNMIGERLKHVFTGYDAYVLSNRKENFDGLGLRPSKRFFLYNGPIEVEMRHYEIFAGRRDDRSKDEVSSRRYHRDSLPVGENKREFKQDFASKRGNRDTTKNEDRSRDRSTDRSSRGRPDGDRFRNRGDRKGGDRSSRREVDTRRGDRDRSEGFRNKSRSRSSDIGRHESPPFDRKSDRYQQSGRRLHDLRSEVPSNTTNSPILKRGSDEHEPEKRHIDLKKRKEEKGGKAPGAERRVRKVFVSRKRRPKRRSNSTKGENKNNNNKNNKGENKNKK